MESMREVNGSALACIVYNFAQIQRRNFCESNKEFGVLPPSQLLRCLRVRDLGCLSYADSIAGQQVPSFLCIHLDQLRTKALDLHIFLRLHRLLRHHLLQRY